MDALIAADPGVLAYASRRHPNLNLHLSVQGSATNAGALNFFQERYGIRRAVLPRVLSLAQVPNMLGDFLIGTFTSKIAFLLALNVVLLLIGMVMDVGPAVMILAPMLMPAANALGINPVHFGVVMVMNLAIGFVTPPFGVNLFVTAPLIDTPVMKVGIKAYPFVLAFIVALLLVTIFPAISLVLLG